MKCGCPEHLLAEKAAAQSQWPRTCMDLKYYATTNGLRGMSDAEFDAQIKQSLANCTEASGLDIKRVQSIGEADVEMRPEPMGGNILAYAYLPSNACGQRLAVRFNSNVNWNPQLFIDTHTHELGHTFGLSHTSDVRDIMYPSMGRDYNGEFSEFYSIPQLTSRYGPEVDGNGNDDNGDDDMGNIPWGDLFEFFIKLITLCIDQSDQAIIQAARNPGPFQKFRVQRETRLAMKLSPRQWREVKDEVMQEIWMKLETASDDDILAVIGDARDRNGS